MKAIIPAAGLGTRFLPATKAQRKEMLPVLDRPVIQYVVEEALAADADEVIIINGSRKVALVEHFSPSPDLSEFLISKGKKMLADAVNHAGDLPVSFVDQDRPLGLGHAVHCAAAKTGKEPFYVLLGDVLVPDNQVLRRMLEVHKRYNGASVIAVIKVPREQVSRFGIIAGSQLREGLWKVNDLVEKPAVEDAPSEYAIFGRYLLTPTVMELLAHTAPGAGGEIQLTDALKTLLTTEEMYAVAVDADEGFDTGTIETWLETNVRLAMRKPEFAQMLKDAITSVG
ncbi:MAG: UTP--glucose-1-phosphate uridylyltransferase [Coriobacteriaceae bacterium]|nr:UTP--glucose-1-phosphate uridylyltransferase [Coriobacteriaceae bacterium]